VMDVARVVPDDDVEGEEGDAVIVGPEADEE